MTAKIFRASKDTKIAAYDIPKGSIIFTNTYAVHMDANYFKRPDEFLYDRFLSADRKKFIKDDHVIAFGYGKRALLYSVLHFLASLIF